mgnify:CR=1 FL=1
MNDKTHINETDFNAFRDNTMLPEKKLAFLEHIGSCTYCADRFAAFMSQDLIKAPVDLKQNILKAVGQERKIKGKVKDASKRIQLLIYSLKVGAAASLALLLLFMTVSLSDNPRVEDSFHKKPAVEISQEVKPPITSVIRDSMDAFCNDIMKLSNSFIR